MKLIRTILISFIILIASVSAGTLFAQTKILIDDDEFRVDATAAIDQLYNRNTEQADAILKPWKNEYPDHPLWAMWSAMELWWDVLDDLPDESQDEELFNAMQKSDFLAGRLLRNEPDHPDALIIRALANGYTARHHANRERWVTSVRVARTAWVAYQRLMEVRPDLPDNDFVEGMKLYYAAYLPDAYPVVRSVSWFLPDGDKEKGINTIEFASENAIFSRAEAAYFAGIILLNYENDFERAEIHFSNLAEKYPDNGYFRRLYARTLANNGQISKARYYSEESLEYWREHNLPGMEVMEEEMYYWIGRGELRDSNPDKAFESFKRSVEAAEALNYTENRLYYILSGYYAGRASERLKDKESAEKYYGIAANQRIYNNVRQRARDRLRNL